MAKNLYIYNLAVSSHYAFKCTVLTSPLQELCLGDLHNFLNKSYTNLGLLACAPEERNLPLHCSE